MKVNENKEWSDLTKQVTFEASCCTGCDEACKLEELCVVCRIEWQEWSQT